MSLKLVVSNPMNFNDFAFPPGYRAGTARLKLVWDACAGGRVNAEDAQTSSPTEKPEGAFHAPRRQDPSYDRP